jgi:hypothetical protein
MFAFEVDEARLRRREAKESQESDVDAFVEWSRWKKGRLPVAERVPQQQQPVPQLQQPQQQQPRAAVNTEPKGEESRTLRADAHCVVAGKEPAEEVSSRAPGVQVLAPLTSSSGKELDRDAVFALLDDEVIVGEDDDFERVLERLEKAEAAPVRTWEELLRVAVLYHQAALHFSGAAVEPLCVEGARAVEALKGHPLGRYVEVMRQSMQHSFAWGGSSGAERTKHIESLRQLVAQHGATDYFPRYVFGVRNWKRLGDMAQLVEIVQAYSGNERKKIVGDPTYCPAVVASWMAYRLGMHNFRVVKRELPATKPRKRAEDIGTVRRMLERAKLLDKNGNAARAASDKALADLSELQDSFEKRK